MVNEEIAKIFENMARVLAFKGKDRFRIMAYERAAVSLRDLEQDLVTVAAAGTLKEIPGIGDDLAEMIEEYIKTKSIGRYERECRGIPLALIELMGIPGLGPKTAALLFRKCQVCDLRSLRRAIESGELLRLRGFGQKKIEHLKHGIDLWVSSRQRMLLGVALPIANNFLENIRETKLVECADLAGSIRRWRETIGDLDVLIASSDSSRALEQAAHLPSVKEVLALGGTRATILIEGGIQVDIRAVAKESYGAALQYFTGSKQHNVHLRSIAHDRGLKINEYGVFRGDKYVAGKTEEEVYRLLGMPFIPPEMREDRGEVEAATEGRLPKLIDLADLKGDLHTHTKYSDGTATVEEMVQHAAGLGYEYIALTDHSPSARIARGLDRQRLEQKFEEVERFREKWGRRTPRVLIGAEVDILPDGSLDYADEILARLDVVIASIHSVFRQSKDRMTGRLLEALSNPHVDILGHPAGRQLGTREPIEFDFQKIVAAVVKAGIALEMNASMYRLDLTDVMARAVQEAGALLAIGSDAHSTAQLDQIRYGIFQARRGWIEARTVVNTWNFAKLHQWLTRHESKRRAVVA
ncbi:MAG TPA: DNA polymerase/3'-5' exonuclease PolX [Bryobacteraceae bacterium]